MHSSFLENFSYFMMAIAKFLVKLAIFLVVVYLIGMRLFDFGHKLFYEKAMNPEDNTEIVYEIKTSDDIDTVAKGLLDAGLIDDANIFKFRAKIYKTRLTPNAYSLNKTMTMKNILDIFDSPSEENIVKRVDDDSVYQLAPEVDNDPS